MDHSPDVSRTDWLAIRVALLAALRDDRGALEVLLTRRAAEVHLGGYWELPGGKLEEEDHGRTEAPRDAACREAAEELGLAIEPDRLEACGKTSHEYPDRTITFDLFLVRLGAEEVAHIESGGVIHAWAPIHELSRWKLPPANDAVNHLLLERLR